MRQALAKLFIFSIILFAGLRFFFLENKNSSIHPKVPSTQLATPGPSPSDSLANQESETYVGLLQETPLCFLQPERPSIELSDLRIYQIYANAHFYKKNIYAFDPDEVCLKVGHVYELSSHGVARGKVKIESMEINYISKRNFETLGVSLHLNQLSVPETVVLLNDYFSTRDLRHNSPDLGIRHVLFVKYRLIESVPIDAIDTTSRVAFIDPLQRVSKSKMGELSTDAIRVDVRSAVEFEKGTIPGAINIPYSFGEDDTVIPTVFSIQKDRFDLAKLGTSLEKPVVVFGGSPIDPRPRAAFLSLVFHRWQNVYWYQGGYNEWKGLPSALPPLLPPQDVKLINTKALSELLLSSKATLVYFGKNEFANRLPRLVRVEYVEAMPMHNPQLALQPDAAYQFAKLGDQLDTSKLPADKNQELIILGDDSSSWLAYKALLALRRQGWRNLSWYREGFGGWVASIAVDPKRYGCPINPDKFECKAVANSSSPEASPSASIRPF